MKKRLVSLMLAGLLTLTLTACGGQKSDSPATSGNGDAAPSGTIVLKCGHVLADGSHFDFGVDKFAELVNEKSGGTLQVEVHTDGTLGQERESGSGAGFHGSHQQLLFSNVRAGHALPL